MEYSYWDEDIIPPNTIVYGFRVDVNSVYTKVNVSRKIKKFIVLEDNRTGRKYFHNVLKNGKVGSIAGGLYYYSLYTDEHEASVEFDMKKQQLRNQINVKINSLNSLIKLIP